MKTKTKKVPIAEWLAMKLVADENGGVGSGRLFGDGALSDKDAGYFEQAPCCLIGIAMEAGVLPLGILVKRPFYRDVHWATLDCVHNRVATEDARIPFEEAMAANGFEPAAR